MKRLMILVGSLLLSSMLGGCYLKSDTKLIEKGVKVPLGSEYSCQGTLGDPKPFITREYNSGWWIFNANYSYHNAAKPEDKFVAMHIKDDLYLIQMKDKPPYDYFHMSVQPNLVIVYGAEFISQPAFLENLKTYNVVLDAGTSKMSGEKDKLLAFLKATPRAAMSPVQTCNLTKK